MDDAYPEEYQSLVAMTSTHLCLDMSCIHLTQNR